MKIDIEYYLIAKLYLTTYIFFYNNYKFNNLNISHKNKLFTNYKL